MHQRIFYIRHLHDPDALDYMIRAARGEFSIFSYDNFERQLMRAIEWAKRFPDLRKKLDS